MGREKSSKTGDSSKTPDPDLSTGGSGTQKEGGEEAKKKAAKLLKKATGGREIAFAKSKVNDANDDDDDDDDSESDDGDFAPDLGAGSDEESEEESDNDDDDSEQESDDDEDDEEDPLACKQEFAESDTQLACAATVAANKPNEDRYLMDTKQRLYGVFDGHGGRHCSEFVVQHIGEVFASLYKGCDNSLENMFFSSDAGQGKADSAKHEATTKTALKGAFKAVDEQFFQKLGEEHNVCGSCGLLCLVEDGSVWAANCGDSRAIIVQQRERGGVHGLALTSDLNTSSTSEVAKVVARSSDTKAVRYNDRDVMSKGANKRVAGSLMVTRALGDGYLKRKELSMPPFEEHVPYITAKPKVTSMHLDRSHSFLVVASDGVWDHLSNDEVAIEIDRAAAAAQGEKGDKNKDQDKSLAMSLIDAVIRKIAEKHGMNAEDLDLNELKPGKFRRDYLDDMTVVVVSLKSSNVPKRGEGAGEAGAPTGASTRAKRPVPDAEDNKAKKPRK